jgi:hypothetical protein
MAPGYTVFCSNGQIRHGVAFGNVQHLLGHTQIKTTARYSHLSQDTLLDASNAVTRAVGHLFMPMVSTNPAAQVQLVQ